MPIPTQLLDLAGSPARDEVFDALLRRIVSGDLAPGARLKDADLLALTSSSRLPLREALNRLELIGLVDVVPRQYTEVTAIDARRTRDCVAVLGEVVHQLLDETARTLDDEDRRRLRTSWSDTLASDDAALAALGSRFTTVLLDRAGNEEYRRVCRSVWPYVQRSLASQGVAGWRVPLLEVVDRTADGDVPAAHKAWRACVDEMRAPFLTDAEPSRVGAARQPVLRERAAQVIEDAILDGTLVPDETLRESELMRWLGVSRTPVRDALLVLEARGLVTLTPHRPARVAALSGRAFREVVRTLGVLRRYALREAVSRDPGVADRWVAAHAGLQAATTPAERFAAIDALSRVVATGTENAVLADLDRALTARLRWYARHRQTVLDAIDADRPGAVAAALADGRLADGVDLLWAIYDELGG